MKLSKDIFKDRVPILHPDQAINHKIKKESIFHTLLKLSEPNQLLITLVPLLCSLFSLALELTHDESIVANHV
jgi:hypothetical protein